MKNTFIIITAAAVLCSCIKWVEPETGGRRIAEKVMPQGASSVSVLVSNGADVIWKACSSDKWLSVNFDGYVQGEYAVTVSCSSNESTPGRRNFARKGYVYVMSYDHRLCDTIVVKQRGTEPVMLMEDVEVSASVTECMIPLSTNLTDEQRPDISFRADQSWVGAMEIAPDNAHVRVRFDSYPSGTATVTMRYVPAWGDEVCADASINIKQ